MNRIVVGGVLASLVWACGGSDAEGGAAMSDGKSNEMNATASALSRVFTNVTPGTPVCFEKTYSSSHLSSHPKQTVQMMRVELSKSEEGSFAKVTFLQKSAGELQDRGLLCQDKNGKAICSEDGCDASVELTRTSGGLRLINQNLRASGSCDDVTTPLDSRPGADDVFDLIPTPCPQPQTGNVECKPVLEAQQVATCIDLGPTAGCDPTRIVKKGHRWMDEVQLGELDEGAKAESEAACIEKFSDVAAEDGCCGG
jgi:hypothetical protein